MTVGVPCAMCNRLCLDDTARQVVSTATDEDEHEFRFHQWVCSEECRQAFEVRAAMTEDKPKIGAFVDEADEEVDRALFWRKL